MSRAFLGWCASYLLERGFVFMFMNAVYFGGILVGALWSEFFYIPEPYMGEPMGVNGFFLGFDLPSMILSIFLLNFFLSSFVFVTLPGLVFFPFPVVVLVARAVFWGFMLNRLPTPLFFAAFPTLILEGEAYVLAGVGGFGLGLSWLKPKWANRKEDLSRLESLKKAFEDCVRIYILVAVLLFVAAVVETVTVKNIYF